MEILNRPSRTSRTRSVCRAVFLLLWLGCVLSPTISSEETSEAPQQFSEHDVKAAYLMNFIKYVEWPEKAFETKESPFRLGVLGEDPFGSALAELTGSTEVGERKISIERSNDIAELKKCHLLFFAKNETGQSVPLSEIDKLPILSVGEQGDFTESGGVINFVLIDSKVRFEISTKAAKKHDLKISSRLLKVSHKVHK